MASPSLHVFKSYLAAFQQKRPGSTHHTQSPETLRRSDKAVCSPFDLHSSDAMNFTQRNSPPEAERLHISLSVCRAVSSRLPPALPPAAIVTGCVCSSFPHWLSSDSRAEGP